MANEYQQIAFMVGADTDGNVQAINIGKNDNLTPIYYELETQEIEFGNRATLKKIANKIVVFSQFAAQSTLEARGDDEEYQPIPMDLSGTVNIGTDLNLEGHFITFKWSGNSETASPVFDGLYLEDVSDMGMTRT